MSAPKTYLITGANRGIGRGILAKYLALPNTTVIAAVRDPSHPTSKDLSTLPKGPSSTLLTVKIESDSLTDASTAIQTLQSKHNITVIDTVIANAGIADTKAFVPLADVNLDEASRHFLVNAVGPLALYQATLPLLTKAGAHGPGKFVTISSPAGSIGGLEQVPAPMPVYGASKAALNYFTRLVHFERKELIAFAVNPGFVQTDMGNAGAAHFGMDKAVVTLDDSASGIVKIVEESTREKTGGHFVSFNEEQPEPLW